MNGYNDKIFLLAETLLEKMKTLVVDHHRLEVMKESVWRLTISIPPTHTFIRRGGSFLISFSVNPTPLPTTMDVTSYQRGSGKSKKN